MALSEPHPSPLRAASADSLPFCCVKLERGHPNLRAAQLTSAHISSHRRTSAWGKHRWLNGSENPLSKHWRKWVPNGSTLRPMYKQLDTLVLQQPLSMLVWVSAPHRKVTFEHFICNTSKTETNIPLTPSSTTAFIWRIKTSCEHFEKLQWLHALLGRSCMRWRVADRLT